LIGVRYLGTVLSLGVALVTGPLHAEDAADESCEALFVQSAAAMLGSAKQLTLKDANPDIIWFCDRPVRQAGHLDIESLIALATEGGDSFATNPPNAALSTTDANGEVTSTIVTLLAKPLLQGDDVIYQIELLEGELPASGDRVLLFIDPIGMPMSPTSVVGRHRRHMRRAVLH
jgi:hypothetical protein